jgi:3-isopropylmalate dehydrogenase
MPTASDFRIAVFAGDGIGHEITEPCLALIELALRRSGGTGITPVRLPAGAGAYRDTGEALPAASLAEARKADAILLAAMGDPRIRYPDGTEIMPQVDLRMELGLYAGVRPVRAIPGVAGPLADPRAATLDLVIIRESTEGLFAHFRDGVVDPDGHAAHDRLTITRKGSERVIDFAFRLAASRRTAGGRGLVTSVDKANAFKSYAFFRKIFDERAALHPDIRSSRVYVDAMALELVRRPWEYDVLVMENIFGDILSDLGAGLMGGLGFAPSADIGDLHAVFQPCHGTAPDIAGKGIANPTAMLLSGAMMLEWLGERHGSPDTVRAGALIRDAIGKAFAGGRLVPYERGGTAGTAAIAAAVGAALAGLE